MLERSSEIERQKKEIRVLLDDLLVEQEQAQRIEQEVTQDLEEYWKGFFNGR